MLWYKRNKIFRIFEGVIVRVIIHWIWHKIVMGKCEKFMWEIFTHRLCTLSAYYFMLVSCWLYATVVSIVLSEWWRCPVVMKINNCYHALKKTLVAGMEMTTSFIISFKSWCCITAGSDNILKWLWWSSRLLGILAPHLNELLTHFAKFTAFCSVV